MKITLVVPGLRPCEQTIEVADGACAADVLRSAQVALPDQYALSIYGRTIEPATVLCAGDRLEVCPPLAQSPTAARRRRMR